MDFDFVTKVLSIIAIDLVLSGDNAVVIAMASRRLPAEQRKKAIILGGGGAVVLRILFTIGAALLLGVPLLQAIGGLLLIYIAIKLVRPSGMEHGGDIKAADSLGVAIRTIIMADVVMSLDNMLAVGGAAHGHIGLLIFGLMLSIPILLFGSSAIARLIDRYPWLNLVGAAILVHTAMEMFFKDKYVRKIVHMDRPIELGVILLIVLAVAGLGWFWNKRAEEAEREARLAQHGRRLDATEPGH